MFNTAKITYKNIVTKDVFFTIQKLAHVTDF